MLTQLLRESSARLTTPAEWTEAKRLQSLGLATIHLDVWGQNPAVATPTKLLLQRQRRGEPLNPTA